ncbi:MAG: hypothetical protein ACTSU2_12685 [Promethearchaeota archaeon]
MQLCSAVLKFILQLKDPARIINISYNYANYNIRKAFSHRRKWTKYTERMDKLLNFLFKISNKGHSKKYLGRPKPSKCTKKYGADYPEGHRLCP